AGRGASSDVYRLYVHSYRQERATPMNDAHDMAADLAVPPDGETFDGRRPPVSLFLGLRSLAIGAVGPAGRLPHERAGPLPDPAMTPGRSHCRIETRRASGTVTGRRHPHAAL